jgi:hypothetical protein
VRGTIKFALVALLLLVDAGNKALGGEFKWCLGDGVFCAETPIEMVGSSCGETFYVTRGRVSTPVLSDSGTVTVAIKTWMKDDTYLLPVYVELVPTDSCSTRGRLSRFFLLEARGTFACGGLSQSIGPIKLATYVPLGMSYTIQLTFFEGWPTPWVRSVAVSCLHVTTTGGSSDVVASTWGDVKRVYR